MYIYYKIAILRESETSRAIINPGNSKIGLIDNKPDLPFGITVYNVEEKPMPVETSKPGEKEAPKEPQRVTDLETRVRKDTRTDTQTSIPSPSYNIVGNIEQPIATVDRRELPMPASHLLSMDILTNERTGRRIDYLHTILEGQMTSNPKPNSYTRGINDLFDRPIGGVFVSELKMQDRNYILIGDASLIGDIKFDFVEGPNSGNLVRVTAYTTEKGRQKMEEYVIGMSRKKFDIVYMPYKRAYDFEVDGRKTHFNLDGKIEIFTPCTEVDRLFPDKRFLNPRQLDKLHGYSRYSRLKHWVGHTNPEFNAFVGRAFYNLSHVLSKVLDHH